MVKFSVYLNGHVFVMWYMYQTTYDLGPTADQLVVFFFLVFFSLTTDCQGVSIVLHCIVVSGRAHLGPTNYNNNNNNNNNIIIIINIIIFIIIIIALTSDCH